MSYHRLLSCATAPPLRKRRSSDKSGTYLVGPRFIGGPFAERKSTRMSARLKIGVIGLGRMGQLYARTLASQVSGVHLYAIADVEEQVRSALAGEFSIPHAFADIHELITLPDLDAVVITTPTRTHPELVIATARAGKAIFCEKPLALT